MPDFYCWPLSRTVTAELHIGAAALTPAEADRLRQYVELTLVALTTPEVRKDRAKVRLKYREYSRLRATWEAR